MKRKKLRLAVIADVGAATGQSAVYYGADVVGNKNGKKERKVQTGPMDYFTVIEWLSRGSISISISGSAVFIWGDLFVCI